MFTHLTCKINQIFEMLLKNLFKKACYSVFLYLWNLSEHKKQNKIIQCQCVGMENELSQKQRYTHQGLFMF